MTNAHREIVHLDPELEIGRELFDIPAPVPTVAANTRMAPAKTVTPNLGSRVLNRFPDWTWFIAGFVVFLIFGLFGWDGLN